MSLISLSYDSRVDAAGNWPRHLAPPPLLSAAQRLGLQLRFGKLVTAERFSVPDRMRWLLETLPLLSDWRLAAFFDATDLMPLCGEAELVAKASRLLSGHRKDGAVIISAEAWMWPRRVTYHGSLLFRRGGAYPESATPLRYVNVGSLLGSPAAMLAVLRCMEQRYGFPQRCPSAVNANGSLVLTPVAGALSEHSGLNEQACWHVYLVEQANGLLPASCPRLVPDARGDLFLPLSKVADDVQWRADGRVIFAPTQAAPCVIHANGASKWMVLVLEEWWRLVHGPRNLTVDNMLARFQKRHRLSSDDLATRYLRKRVLPALQGGASSLTSPGVCEFTTDNEGASCSTWDFKGSWTARSLRACVARCATCGHCFHISYDKRSHDCSFFRFCDSTYVVGTGHTTHQVRHSDGTPAPSVAGLSTAALQLSWSPPHKPAPELPSSFFMYSDPALDHGWLRHCPGFEELQAGVRAERLGEVRMRDVLSRSSRRVSDPAAAQLLYVPLWEYASYALGQCNGTNHTQRMARAADALRASPQFARSRGADHVWVSTASRLHDGEVAGWLDTSVGSDFGGYFGLYARVGKPLAPLLERTIVGRYKSHGPLRSRVGASVVEIPFPANQHVSHEPAERGGHARPTLLYFAGSLDVCCAGREIRCAVAELVGNQPHLVAVRIEPSLRDSEGPMPPCTARALNRSRSSGGRLGERQRLKSANLGAASSAPAAVRAARQMARARFCLVPAGDECVSSRLYTAIAAGCLPVVICDWLRGAFDWAARYGAFWIKVPRVQFLKDPASVLEVLRSMPPAEEARRRALLDAARADVLYARADSRVGTHLLTAAAQVVSSTHARRLAKPSGSRVERAAQRHRTQHVQVQTNLAPVHLKVKASSSPLKGHCSSAPLNANCEVDDQGSWSASESELRSGEASLAAACVRRCLQCTRCRYVSFSAKWRDCSWFRHCDTGNLLERTDGFQTIDVRAEPPRPPDGPAVTFVTSFHSLHGFRDTDTAYIDSFRLVSRLPNLLVYCGPEECTHLRRVAPRATFVVAALKEMPLWSHREVVARVVRRMFEQPQLDATLAHARCYSRVACSMLLSRGRKDVEAYIQWLLITHAKIHWLARAATANPFGSEQVIWVDAGLFRYHKHVVGFNPFALGCYATRRARFPIDARSAAWPTRTEALYLIKPRREILATIMVFNRTYLLQFGPAYFRRLEEHLGREEMSIEQAVLTLMAVERPEEFEHVPTDNYRHLARLMLNC